MASVCGLGGQADHDKYAVYYIRGARTSSTVGSMPNINNSLAHMRLHHLTLPDCILE